MNTSPITSLSVSSTQIPEAPIIQERNQPLPLPSNPQTSEPLTLTRREVKQIEQPYNKENNPLVSQYLQETQKVFELCNVITLQVGDQEIRAPAFILLKSPFIRTALGSAFHI